jgi:ParB-like chromosome segregation protein Spo0J
VSRPNIVEYCKEMFQQLQHMPLERRIETINAIRAALAEYSPFKTEPVDCVQWVPNTQVKANDYNPNTVAPPEMKLLELSIQEDGYTQPIVSYQREDGYEVVDGFHRHRVGKESKLIQKRIQGYLPVVVINKDRTELTDRMASTIRHNRARGKHGVDSMSDIVVELKKRNRSDDWIAKHLGMDPDEVLRLCQVSGLVEMFSNTQFSQSWDIETKDDGVENFEGLDEEAI